MIRLLLFISLLIPTLLFAQEEKLRARGAKTESVEAFTGKTHAVIIGISFYDTIPSLNFAHRDAEAFSEFLHSPYYSGGPVKDTLLINSKAKKLDIIKQIKGLYHRVEEGDRIVIFFAGHGDREVESGGSYLLAYDTFLNNYSATAVSVDWLKRSINTLITDKKVTVWLIADACRSGDFTLAGDFIRGRYRVWESWQPEPGELNLLSCQSKELSYEADKWDKGHGIFSYFLLRGLHGGADSIGNNDAQTRAFELDAYLKLKVPTASKNIQTPLMNTSDMQTIVATIPPQIVNVQTQPQKLASQQSVDIQVDLINSQPKSFLRQTPAIDSSKTPHKRLPKSDSIQSKSGTKGDTIVKNKRLNNEALYFELMARVEPILLAYLARGSEATSAEAYAVTSIYVAQAEKLLPSSDPDYRSTRALKHFFLGVNLNKTGRPFKAIAQLDSAIALDAFKAFFYYERGIAYLERGLKDRANQDFNKALQLSPTWSLVRSKKDDIEKMLAMSTSTNGQSPFLEQLQQQLEKHATYAVLQKKDKKPKTSSSPTAETSRPMAPTREPSVYIPATDRSGNSSVAGEWLRKAESETDPYRKIDFCNQALKADPSTIETYYFRAIYLVDVNNYEKAVGDYTKFLEYRPDNSEALNGRGYCKEQLGQAY